MKHLTRLGLLRSFLVVSILSAFIGWHFPEQTPKKMVVNTLHLIGDNLISNPGCEEVGRHSSKQWAPSSIMTFASYDPNSSELGDPTLGPNVKDRGTKYFRIALNGVPSRTVTQTIDLTAGVASIDSGSLKFTLGGWMGGMADQPVTTLLHATFKDASGNMLLHVMTDTVGAIQRDNKSTILYREVKGDIPAQARSVVIGLEAAMTDATCSTCTVVGYADNLKFALGYNFGLDASK